MELVKHSYNKPMHDFDAPYVPGVDQMFIIDYIVYKHTQKIPKTYLTYAPSREFAQRKTINLEKGERISFIKIWGCFPWELQECSEQ
jgi:hypothetical protein